MKNYFEPRNLLDSHLSLFVPDATNINLGDANADLKRYRKKLKKAKNKPGKKAKREAKKLKRKVRELEQTIMFYQYQLCLAQQTHPRGLLQELMIQSAPELIKLAKAYIKNRSPRKPPYLIDTTGRDIDRDYE